MFYIFNLEKQTNFAKDWLNVNIPLVLKIIISEDHSIIRLGTMQLIKELYNNVEIEEAASFEETLELLGKGSFNLLILDINMPGGNMFNMIEVVRLRQKDIKILVFSSYDEKLYALRFLEAGANGYLAKSAEPAEIKIAIKRIIDNGEYISPLVQKQLINTLKHKKDGKLTGIASLTDKELEVVRLLVKGIGTNEIAQTLHLQKTTISTYKARIFEKLEVSNIIELAYKTKFYDTLSLDF